MLLFWEITAGSVMSDKDRAKDAIRRMGQGFTYDPLTDVVEQAQRAVAQICLGKDYVRAALAAEAFDENALLKLDKKGEEGRILASIIRLRQEFEALDDENPYARTPEKDALLSNIFDRSIRLAETGSTTLNSAHPGRGPSPGS
jgi:hypothetical protein